MHNKLTRRDFWTLPVLVALLGILALMSLQSGHWWGDDYAGYLNEAIAISEGRLDEQIHLNVMMHPSPMTFLEEDADTLTYVWGYPLILSVIHRFVGYDTWNYSSLIFYKLPGVCALAALGGLLFVFYRRHFSYFPSLVLSLLFCLNPQFFSEVNNLSPELPFLFCFVLGLWLVEVMLDQQRLLRRIPLMIALGVALWASCILRLNGTALIAFVALAHFIGILRTVPKTKRLLFDLVPYVICGLLLLVSYSIFPAPTSNHSDVGKLAFSTLWANIRYYFQLLIGWFSSLFSRSTDGVFYAKALGYLMFGWMVLGIGEKGIRKNLHLTLIILSTFATVCLLDYRQGLRYLYTILPYALFFAAHGAAVFFNRLSSHVDSFLRSRSRWTAFAVGLLVTVTMLAATTQQAITSFRTRGDALPDLNPYSTYAVDTYRYIQSDTDEESVIAFYKPRSLYLNTGRLSFKPQLAADLVVNPDAFLPYQPHYRPLTDADYVLFFDDWNHDEYQRVLTELDGSALLEPVYKNKYFELYKIV